MYHSTEVIIYIFSINRCICIGRVHLIPTGCQRAINRSISSTSNYCSNIYRSTSRKTPDTCSRSQAACGTSGFENTLALQITCTGVVRRGFILYFIDQIDLPAWATHWVSKRRTMNNNHHHHRENLCSASSPICCLVKTSTQRNLPNVLCVFYSHTSHSQSNLQQIPIIGTQITHLRLFVLGQALIGGVAVAIAVLDEHTHKINNAA